VDGETAIGIGLSLFSLSLPGTAAILKFIPSRNSAIPGHGRTCEQHAKDIIANQRNIAVMSRALDDHMRVIATNIAEIKVQLQELRK